MRPSRSSSWRPRGDRPGCCASIPGRPGRGEGMDARRTCRRAARASSRSFVVSWGGRVPRGDVRRRQETAHHHERGKAAIVPEDARTRKCTGRIEGSVRVIGGEYRGRKLRAPEGMTTRPTSDRVREALFDILARRVPGARFLDAYAGSGAVGIEALSRGAYECVFVENGRAAGRMLASNLASLGIADRATVLDLSFTSAAARLGGAGRLFDIVFLD